MESFALLGGSIVVALSFAHNPEKTIPMVTAAVAIRGITYVATKVTKTMNIDASEMINFAGWCLAGVPILGLIGLSLESIKPIGDSIHKTVSTFQTIGQHLEDFANWIDKWTIWN